MRHVIESGKPILVDLLSNKAGTFVVSRIPLRDEAGQVIGALGMVLFDPPETTLQPLIAKFATLQRDLDERAGRSPQQRRTKYTLASFIGSSPAVLEVKRQARRAAQSGATVLLLGETGTGKELLAHRHSRRLGARGAPVHQREPRGGAGDAARSGILRRRAGAYTGADRKGRDGKFRLADGGTLFLDEIGDMPLALQAKLLRALQEQEFEPSARTRSIKVTCASSPPPAATCASSSAKGASARTCIYRLNVLPIRLPTLRDRLCRISRRSPRACSKHRGAYRHAAARARAFRARRARFLSVAGQRARAAQPARAGGNAHGQPAPQRRRTSPRFCPPRPQRCPPRASPGASSAAQLIAEIERNSIDPRLPQPAATRRRQRSSWDLASYTLRRLPLSGVRLQQLS
jgi:hypothetical protein